MIDGEGFRISVLNGNPSVAKTELAGWGARMTQNEALLRIFGLKSLLLPEDSLKNWVPLPFMIDGPDTY